MSKQVWKGSALVAPVPPALVSCGTLEAPNVLTVAWTGMLQSQPPKTYISVRPERYSHGLITESREFVINLPTAALVRAIDYCGVIFFVDRLHTQYYIAVHLHETTV